MPHIVLASGSPRRQELLRRIGVTEFDIRVPRTDEHYPAGLTPPRRCRIYLPGKGGRRRKALYPRGSGHHRRYHGLFR